MVICQECGRAATYARKPAGKYRGAKKHQGTAGRRDHDLCRRCWHKLMEAINVSERES